MNANFYDIDVLIRNFAQPWIVSKSNPNKPIMKISQSDFNLFRGGIYKSHGNKIKIGNEVFWISNDVMDQLKIKSKNLKSNISDLSISMKEFLDPEMDSIKFEINKDIIDNISDDIYIICSKNTKNRYSKFIKKIEDILMESNKSIKSYYYISETFYNRNDDDISFKKIRILLQHLVGYKSDGDKFTSETITKYDKISFYDDDQGTLRLAIDINHLLRLMIGKTEEQVSESIKKIVKSSDCELVVNEVTPNINNRLIKTEVCLEYSNIIKTFESFSHRGRL